MVWPCYVGLVLSEQEGRGGSNVGAIDDGCVCISFFVHILANIHNFSLQKELEGSITARKGGPFRLNLHPKAFFDHNPYRTDKCELFSLRLQLNYRRVSSTLLTRQ